MKSRSLTIATLLSLVTILIIAIPTAWYFIYHGIPNSTPKLAEFGTFFGGLTTPILTNLTIIVLVFSLIIQRDIGRQNEIDNRNNLILPKTLEAFQYYHTDFYDFTFGKKKEFDSTDPVEINRKNLEPCFYVLVLSDFYRLKCHVKENDAIGKKFNYDARAFIEKLDRIAEIEYRLSMIRIPYFCIEKDIAEINLIYQILKGNVQKLVSSDDAARLKRIDARFDVIDKKINGERQNSSHH